MASAMVIDTSSGMSTHPPRMLKRCSSGTDQFSGEPYSSTQAPGMSTTSARLAQNTGKGCPVARRRARAQRLRSEEHTSELQSRENLVCRLLLEKKKKTKN